MTGFNEFLDLLGERKPNNKMGSSRSLADLLTDVSDIGAFNSGYLDTVSGTPIDPSIFSQTELRNAGFEDLADQGYVDPAVDPADDGPKPAIVRPVIPRLETGIRSSVPQDVGDRDKNIRPGRVPDKLASVQGLPPGGAGADDAFVAPVVLGPDQGFDEGGGVDQAFPQRQQGVGILASGQAAGPTLDTASDTTKLLRKGPVANNLVSSQNQNPLVDFLLQLLSSNSAADVDDFLGGGSGGNNSFVQRNQRPSNPVQGTIAQSILNRNRRR